MDDSGSGMVFIIVYGVIYTSGLGGSCFYYNSLSNLAFITLKFL